MLTDVFLREIVERDGRCEITTSQIVESERHRRNFWDRCLYYAEYGYRKMATKHPFIPSQLYESGVYRLTIEARF